MAEDDWTKKRKRSEDSSSDESSQYSSAYESHQESEEPAEKTGSVFDGSPHSDSKAVLLTPRTKELDFTLIESASCSGLSRRKCHKDVAKGVKRRLWDVDTDQVDLDLDRELKRMHREETLEKAAKWNFDFERDAPLSGDWSWYSTQSAPNFYKTKDITTKFKPTQPPTISKWSSEPPIIQATVPTQGNLIRPKAIRATTSKPSAVQISFLNAKESTKSLQHDGSSSTISSAASSGDEEKLQPPATGLDKANTVASEYITPTPVVTSSAGSDAGNLNSPSTSSCSTERETIVHKYMILRPRKRQKLERKKSSPLKRFR